MDPLDFEGKTSNEILEELALATEWLAAQFAAAKLLLPSTIAVAAEDDVQAAFFWDANRKHLPVLAANARYLKVPPPPEPLTLDPP
ncbi:MAG: hypothetical protein ACK5X3_14390 [Pseudomonadota bacterium]|jgi:hypothetical protein